MTATPAKGTERRLHRDLTAQLKQVGYGEMSVRRMYNPERKIWMTGTSAPGWPDITAMRGAYLLAIEVKNDRTYPDPQQVAWLARFALLPYARAWVLRPRDDWDMVKCWIGEPGSAPRTHGWTNPANA